MSDFDKQWFDRYNDSASKEVPDYSYSYLTKKEFDRCLKLFFKVFDSSNISKDSKILDMGCGVGVYTNELYSRGYTNLYGVDYSSGFIDIAKKRNSNINYSVGNIYSLNFQDSTFDVVICLGLFQSIFDENRAVNELKRVLKPGGKLFIMTLKEFNLIEKLGICLLYLPYMFIRGDDISKIKRVFNNIFGRKLTDKGVVSRRYKPSFFNKDGKMCVRYLNPFGINISFLSTSFLVYSRSDSQ